MRGMIPAACLLLVAGMLAADELETIEGVRITGTIESISDSGEVAGEGIPSGTTTDLLRSITRENKSPDARPKMVLETHGNGRLLIETIALADDKFTVTLASGAEVSLPLDAVRCLRFEPDLVMTAFAEALAKPSPDQDKIFVKVEKQIDAVSGLVTELTDAELRFEYEGEERKLPRERLHGIVFAQTGEPKTAPAVIHLAGGSRLAGKIASLKQGQLEVELQGGAKSTLPYDSVKRIDLRSSRVSFLSDLEPAEVNEQSVLTIARPWQRDRSVSGKTLTLGSRTFARGLGVHAKSELKFAVPEEFDLFAAVVGIDAASGGKGDCEMEILGDDRSLWKSRIKGTDQPQDVKVELRGVKQITLRVEPGVDFDFGDHANWCDARFLKSK